MPRTRLARPLALALIGSFVAGSVAHAQVPAPVPVPPPPPLPMAPAPYPPPVYPPPVYPSPYRPAPVVVVTPRPALTVYDPGYDGRRAHDRMMARVFTGVGTTALVLGFFSLMAGIPVLVLTSTKDLCTPSATHSCDSYYALSYGLIGGGVAAMVAGTALDIVGTVYRYRARYASIDVAGPRLALLPAADGKIGGAALALSVRF